MTQDEIIRMAREAGLLAEDEAWVSPHQEAMERFAALVAAHEREKQAEQEPVACINGCDTSNGKCVDCPDAAPVDAKAVRARGE